MIIKAGGTHKIHVVGIEHAPVKSSTTTEDCGSEPVAAHENTASSIHHSTSRTASVKFMITMQDEEGLRKLGYSQAEIDKIKPQEALDILRAGRRQNIQM